MVRPVYADSRFDNRLVGHGLGVDLPMRGLIDAIWPFSIESRLSCAYRRALSRHGSTPQGVFWNSSKSQTLRFAALLGAVANHAGRRSPSIVDMGCGYGPMLDYMRDRPQYRSWHYAGIDITRAMIAEARRRHPQDAARFDVGRLPSGRVDYAVFSGTFNLCLIDDLERWQRYILNVLAACWPQCRYGMALNLLCRRETAIEARIFYAVETEMTEALHRFGRVEAAPTIGLKHDVTFLVTR